MKDNKFMKVAIIILMTLLITDIASRLFINNSQAIASKAVQYKIVPNDNIKSYADYENLLNDMANKGWVFDHNEIVKTGGIVFRK